MSALDGILSRLDTANFGVLAAAIKPLEIRRNGISRYLKRCNDVTDEFKRTGVVPASASMLEHLKQFFDEEDASEISSDRSSIKENIEIQKPVPKSRRTKKQSKAAGDPPKSAYVKLEKLSLCPEEMETNITKPLNSLENVQVKVEEMPAPTRPAPRKKGRARTKQPKQEPEERDSVILIQENIPVINLDSSNETEETLKSEPEPRTTRTKTIKKKAKRSRSSSEEQERQRDKRSKSGEEKVQNITNQSEYEDAASTITNEVNTTFVATTNTVEQQNMNATVVVDNPKYVNNLVPQTVNDIMTDDESEEETKKKSPKPEETISKSQRAISKAKEVIPKAKGAIPRAIKPIFSPFEQSPVKKRVEEFEKLKEKTDATSSRTTRTKTRAQVKRQEMVDSTEPEPEVQSNVKEKAKIFTPLSSKFVPKVASTAAKQKPTNSSSSESFLSVKTASALKASQAEYRERERLRREKEEEALKKREALIQAQIEEKKRKREEKQLKAQQHREALEKEKLKALEAQKLKDERHKQILAEQEERKLKQREELEKKRQMAKMRVIEEKKREEEKRLEEQKMAEQMAANLSNKPTPKIPIYMRTKNAPFLPTADCYDSDDEMHRNNQTQPPDWGLEHNIQFQQQIAFAAGEALKNTFFSIQAQSVDLQEVFVIIEPKKLKRSSSAMWQKQPRFTMIPALENHDETEEFDDTD